MLTSKLLKCLECFPTVVLTFLLAIPAAAQQAEESSPKTAETLSADDATADDGSVDDADTDDGSVDDADTDDANVDDAIADDASEAADEVEDDDLDEQTYEQDDDDFIPTEEIPADEPIPFPSNI